MANPWNDPNLAEGFVWGKKVEKDRARGVVEDTSREAAKRTQAKKPKGLSRGRLREAVAERTSATQRWPTLR